MKKFSRKLMPLLMGALFCLMCFSVQTRAEETIVKPTQLDKNVDIDFDGVFGDAAQYNFTLPAGQEQVAIPFELPISGLACLSVACNEGEDHVSWGLYKDSDLDDHVDYDMGGYSWEEGGVAHWLEKGTYYLGLKYDIYYDYVTGQLVYNTEGKHFVVKASCFSADNADNIESTSGKWVTVAQSHQENYYKIVAPKRGYIRVEVKSPYEHYAASYVLCDSKKRELSGTEDDFYGEYYNGKSHDFAVEKGTYYLKLYDPDGPSDLYKFRYTFNAVADKKNYTIKKAVTVKPGKNVACVIYTKDKQAAWERWYKIKLTKKKRVSLSYSVGPGSYTNEWHAELCDSKGNWISPFWPDNGVEGTEYTPRKIAPGTYYIKINTNYRQYTPESLKQTMGMALTFKWK